MSFTCVQERPSTNEKASFPEVASRPSVIATTSKNRNCVLRNRQGVNRGQGHRGSLAEPFRTSGDRTSVYPRANGPCGAPTPAFDTRRFLLIGEKWCNRAFHVHARGQVWGIARYTPPASGGVAEPLSANPARGWTTEWATHPDQVRDTLGVSSRFIAACFCG